MGFSPLKKQLNQGNDVKALLKRLKRRQVVESDAAPELDLLSLKQRLPDVEERHLETVLAVSDLTMTSPERIVALTQAVDYISSQSVPGEIVECGVWRGGSMAAIARTLNHHNTERELWLFDTFEGMSPPTDVDVDFLGNTAEALLDSQDRDNEESVWCCSTLSTVREAMEATCYPPQKIRYVVGKVEETLNGDLPESIALLRLDTDWYESTKIELEMLFPRLVPGGVLIVDDYGHWEGCRRAVDEYLSGHGIRMLLNRIDYTGRIGIKAEV